MVATLTTLITRVRGVCRDASGDFVTDAEITQWINEAITDIAARQALLETELTGTTSGNSIALPPSGTTETLSIDFLMLGTEGDEAVFVDDEIWQSYADSGAAPTFTLARIYNETIYLYPTPDAGTAFTIRMTSVPAPLTTGSQTHAIPLHLEKKLTDYASAYAFYKMGELERGDRYMVLYESGLFPVASGRETTRPGPYTLVPIEGPYDIDADARHW